jgi:hypothetical protein
MTRRRLLIIVMLFAVSALAADKEETLDQLKQRAERASQRDQPKLFLELAERQLKTADSAYNEGKVDQARTAVEEVAGFSEKAGTAAIATRNHLKQAEIRIRDMEHKLSDIRRTVSFDDRPPLEAAISRMEKIRGDLLKAMFGPKS